MQTTLYAAFRPEFIAVSGESRPDLPPDHALRTSPGVLYSQTLRHWRVGPVNRPR
jgi:hypothetical protein